MSEQSLREEWSERFDLVPQDTPLGEHPEEKGFQLVCRIDGCAHEERLTHLDEFETCDWTQLGYDEAILTNGDTLHLGYCPVHSLEEEKDQDPHPLQAAETCGSAQAEEDDDYAMYDFLEGEVEAQGALYRCDSCLRELELGFGEEPSEHGWVSFKSIGALSDGRCLYEGRCPEHRE